MSLYTITLRVEQDLVSEIDRLVDEHVARSGPTASVTRTSVITWLIKKGLADAEKTRKPVEVPQ